METQQDPILFSLLPLFIFTIPLVIGNYFLAKRIPGASPTAWVLLSLFFPINFLFFTYVTYKVIFTVLDRLPPRNEESGSTKNIAANSADPVSK